MIHQSTMNHILAEPTLHEQIIMAQLHDKGVGIIKQKLSQEKRSISAFIKTIREFYGLEVA
jgi:hypothetical protein